MLSVGISGGIGSGKTLVCTIFQILGVSIYNSDLKAKKIMETNQQVKKEIIKLLGEESYLNNLTLNRKYIAKKVFNQKELLFKLNDIVHPAVRQDAEIWSENLPKDSGYYLRESAILFETGIYKQLNLNILVIAPEKLRMQRIKNRDGLSDEDITLRIKNQWDDEQKLKLTDFVIINDGKNFLIPQILKIHRTLKNYPLMPNYRQPNINL
jgi:dephospho-CoA kinase